MDWATFSGKKALTKTEFNKKVTTILECARRDYKKTQAPMYEQETSSDASEEDKW